MKSNPSPTQRRTTRLLLAGVVSGLAACRDKDITAYRIPKDPDADQVQAAPAAAPVPSASPAVRWVAPAGWQSQPATGMRAATFLVTGAAGATADVSVVSFPGMGGDDLANINRWRNQVKLPPITGADLAGQTQGVTTAAGAFVTADLAGDVPGKGATRILGAWLRQPDHVWFFKMIGPSDLVESQKAAFLSFLQSVNLAVGAADGTPLAQNLPGAANTNDLPRGGGMDSVPVQSAAGASLLWQAPAGWQNQPGNAMRKGSYAVGGGAEVAITAFPGDVGGILANVNRWRGQAGLDPVDDAGLAQATTAIDANGLHIIVVDAEGGATAIVAGQVPWNGGTWFFKLTGPTAAVAKAKPAFLDFLNTVRTP